jgi:hypothetical protein
LGWPERNKISIDPQAETFKNGGMLVRFGKIASAGAELASWQVGGCIAGAVSFPWVGNAGGGAARKNYMVRMRQATLNTLLRRKSLDGTLAF